MMKGFLRFATRYPILFTLLIFPVIPLGLMALQVGIAWLFGFSNVGPGIFQDSSKVLAVMVYLLILWRFGWLRPAGLVLYGGSIWPVVVGHFLVDAIGNGNLVSIPDTTWANRVIFWWEMPLLVLGSLLVYWVSKHGKQPRRRNTLSQPEEGV